MTTSTTINGTLNIAGVKNVPGQPFVTRSASSTQNFPTATFVTVLFDSLQDLGGAESPTYSAGVFTIGLGGLYAIDATLDFLTVSPNGNVYLRIIAGNQRVGDSSDLATTSSVANRPTTSAIAQLEAGDTVFFEAWQNSGITRTTRTPSAAEATRCCIAKIA